LTVQSCSPIFVILSSCNRTVFVFFTHFLEVLHAHHEMRSVFFVVDRTKTFNPFVDTPAFRLSWRLFLCIEEMLKGDENSLCVHQCGKKHCVRCYLLTLRHTIYTDCVVDREDRTQQNSFSSCLVIWEGRTE
jgi:hypothetical protein